MDYNERTTCRNFEFPTPPRLRRSNSCSSDTSSNAKSVENKTFRKLGNIRYLLPVGIFWDIENCQVPKSKSATYVVQRIRHLLYNDYREAEFVVVCDVKKESTHVIQDLNDAQVNLIHVQSTSKNAADEKLRQSLRRFAEVHQTPAAVVLISSDINFAADLSDLRYRRKLHVILIHNSNVADALILCASETFNFNHITESVPSVTKAKEPEAPTDLCVSNIPVHMGLKHIKSRLKLLSDNCGGRILEVNLDVGYAVLRFNSIEIANRAQKRLDGEDVYGNKIRVSNSSIARDSPFKNYTGRKIRHQELLYQVQPTSTQIPAVFGLSFPTNYHQTSRNVWKGDVSHEAVTFRPIRGSSFSDASFQDGVNTPVKFDSSAKILQTAQPIELIISNIDSSIEFVDLRNLLLNMLKQYALVQNLTIITQVDGSPVANVKVSTQQEAQFAISQLHHQWLGSKRLSISYAQNNSDPERLRGIVISLLQEVPGNKMPLFKFFELVESRYHTSVSLFEVNKLKDICKISDGVNGRMISLTPEATITSSVHLNNSFAMYCTIHCPNGLDSRGWCEAEDVELPNIRMPLKLFAKKVNDVLASHLGHLPLLSFHVCYAHEFGEPLPTDGTGVPLEHLLTCIGNIQLSYCDQNKNIKYVMPKVSKKKEKGKDEDQLMKSVSPSLITNITMLCREIVDLLKTTDCCQLLMSRFIPAYHHHFGRQCRVADYGFTRLVDLFEAISHIVQILGSGAKRTITLTHSAQIRRFTSDLLRVLKSQVSKQLSVIEFPQVYEKVIGKAFNPVEYGLCTLEDLLDDIPENTVVFTNINNLVNIAIPKREQTAEEMQRTEVFATEVVELLRHVPYCSMLFNKFVPAYHHHFGRQCKVSDYGFTKLAELFEAIPKTVELEGSTDIDRRIKLQRPLALKVLGSQIQMLIKESKLSGVVLEILPAVYKRAYGCTLKPQFYNCNNFEELIDELGDFIQVVHSSAGPLLVLTDIDKEISTVRVWALLLNPPHVRTVMAIIHDYRLRYLNTLPLARLEQMKDVVMISGNGTDTLVTLTEYYVKAAQLYHLLFVNGGHITINSVESFYFRKFGRKLCPDDNSQNLQDFLKHMHFLIVFKGTKKISIYLNRNLVAYGVNLPPSITQQQPFNTNNYEESIYWSSPASHNLISSLNSKAPPKPDTPPALNGWNNKSVWLSPRDESNLNLSIPLSSFDHSKVMLDTEGLISPTRGLLSAHTTHPMDTVLKMQPPKPQDVPLPDKLFLKVLDDCNDSGFNTSRIEFDNLENDCVERPHSSGALSRPTITKTFSTFSM